MTKHSEEFNHEAVRIALTSGLQGDRIASVEKKIFRVMQISSRGYRSWWSRPICRALEDDAGD